MSKAFIYGNGGSTDELNVKFYTSEDDIPAVGRENDIAVVTSQVGIGYRINSNIGLIDSPDGKATLKTGYVYNSNSPLLYTDTQILSLVGCLMNDDNDVPVRVPAFIWHDDNVGYFSRGWSRLGQYLAWRGEYVTAPTPHYSGNSFFTLAPVSSGDYQGYLVFPKTLTSSTKQSGYSLNYKINSYLAYSELLELKFHAVVLAETPADDVVFRMGTSNSSYTDANSITYTDMVSLSPTATEQELVFTLVSQASKDCYLTISIAAPNLSSGSRTPNVIVKGVWVE